MKVEVPETETRFLKAGTNIKDEDLITFIDEGKWETADFGGKKKERFNITVKIPSGEEKIATLNNTSLQAIVEAYGDESSEWVGKEAKINVLSQMVSGERKEVIYFSHPNKDLEGNIINE